MKQQVLNLIHRFPNIRTVEISDRLDIDVEQVRPYVAAEISSGEIVEEPIIAPNGRTVQSFRFKDAAPVAAAVAATLAPEPTPARVTRALPPTSRPVSAVVPVPAVQQLVVAPAPVAKTLDIDVPVTRKDDVPLVVVDAKVATSQQLPVTRVERGMALLREKHPGIVGSAELAIAMGLPVKHSPYSYLQSAIRSGRAVCVGREWALGPKELARLGLPAAAEAPAPAAAAPEAVPEAAPAPEFPRATPFALMDYQPGSKQCTMSCTPHPADPRSAAERALMCPDCVPVAAAAVPHPEPVSALAQEAAAGGVVEPVPAPVPVPVDRAPRERAYWGGNDRYPVPRVAKDAPELGGCGRFENGKLVKTAEQLLASAPARDPAAARFIAGVLSDGSLHLRIPGQSPVDLPPDDARALYEFLQAHGYAAWPKQAA